MADYQAQKDNRIHRNLRVLEEIDQRMQKLLDEYDQERGPDRTSDAEDGAMYKILNHWSAIKRAMADLHDETSEGIAQAVEKEASKARAEKAAAEKLAQMRAEFAKLPPNPDAPCCRCGDETPDRCRKCKRPVCWDCSGSNALPGVYCLSYLYPGCHP